MKKYFVISFGIILFAILYIPRKERNHKHQSRIITDFGKSSAMENQDTLWVHNAIHGISIETPKELKLQMSKIPAGHEKYIDEMVIYGYKGKNMIVLVTFMKTNYETYNLKTSQESSIGNLVNVADGKDLKLEFVEINNDKEDILCLGTFKIENIQGIVRSYAYWNGNGKFASVACIGLSGDQETNSTTFKRILNSIRIAF